MPTHSSSPEDHSLLTKLARLLWFRFLYSPPKITHRSPDNRLQKKSASASVINFVLNKPLFITYQPEPTPKPSKPELQKPWYSRLFSKSTLVEVFSSSFWLGAISTALQGVSNIEIFVITAATIPWLGFLAYTPWIIIFASGLLMCHFSLNVEQLIFKPHFENLIKEIFGEGKVKSVDQKAKEIIRKTQKIQTLKRLLNKSTALEAPLPAKYSAAWFLHKVESFFSPLKIQFYQIKSKCAQNKILYQSYYIFANVVALLIMGLRAIVSVGSGMLGIKILFGLAFAFFGVTTLPSIIIPFCALTAFIGYVNKTSQNSTDQRNETLKWMGIEKYIRSDLKRAKKNYKNELKDKIPLLKSNNLSTGASLLFHALLGGFIFGLLGASAQSFFSIPKFVQYLGSVKILSFLNHITPTQIFTAATISAVYTMVVEQWIQYPYYRRLVSGLFNTKVYKKDYHVSDQDLDAFLNDKFAADGSLKYLFKGSYEVKIIVQDDSTVIYRIIFTSRAAYKFYKLNEEMNELCRKNNTTRKPISVEIPKDKVLNFNNRHWLFKYVYYNYAKVGTVFILLLRAISSIGPQTVGLSVMLNSIAFQILGFNLLPALVITSSILMTWFGYSIKCSQNLNNHYFKCLNNIFKCNILDVDDFYDTLGANIDNEYITLLEIDHKRRHPELYSRTQNNNLDVPCSPLSDNHSFEQRSTSFLVKSPMTPARARGISNVSLDSASSVSRCSPPPDPSSLNPLPRCVKAS